MEARKNYGQFCALARALDHVGDRWTLLIIRELLIAPRSFRELQQALPGLSPNLLVRRLRALIHDGLVLRNTAPMRSKSVIFQLTEAGLALEATAFELIRWGARWMTTGPGPDRVDPTWSILAVRALLDGTPITPITAYTVHINADGSWLTIRTHAGTRQVIAGRSGTPDATVTARMPSLLAVITGHTALETAEVDLTGKKSAVETALRAAPSRTASTTSTPRSVQGGNQQS
ncbi:MAG: helix-turn-helix transcriptional regulator [Mycobacteriaceae bacterium]|nr:helix-turn-helix transcriptional regulator [Mycobacteriaceae bacterium]